MGPALADWSACLHGWQPESWRVYWPEWSLGNAGRQINAGPFGALAGSSLSLSALSRGGVLDAA